MTNKPIYIDFHVLQTVPPSCVNRDDTGSPKTAVYGGAVRARVSSQAWKHAMRVMFGQFFAAEQVGKRTKRIVALVANEITALNAALTREEAEKLATQALERAGLKIKNAEKGTDALFFISRAQAAALAKLEHEKCKDKKAFEEALDSAPSVDMALFGRMVASAPSLNSDAAAQVAHSISTHAVHNEYDFFAAVDDCSTKDNAGAGHIGTVEFNSATLYRYATLNVNELAGHIGADTANVVRGFAETFVRSMPAGMQNSFANRTLPNVVYVTVRRDQPVNLCGAFEEPVKGREGYAKQSIKRLADHAKKMYAEFADEPALALSVGGMGDMARELPLKGLLNELEGWVKENADCGVV